MIKNIIFDIGNVLIRWDPDSVYADYFNSTEKMTAFYQETGIHLLNKQLDRGMPFAVGLEKLAEQFPHYREPIWFWRDRWTDMLKEEITGSTEIVKNLHRRSYTLYSLTNWSAETFPYALKKYQFFSYFKDIVVSGKESCVKPEPEIYQILLQRNNLTASECMFIDDSVENVKAASLLGIAVLHFTDPNQLAKDLELILSM